MLSDNIMLSDNMSSDNIVLSDMLSYFFKLHTLLDSDKLSLTHFLKQTCFRVVKNNFFVVKILLEIFINE
jgi:hypothetical protein